jgi:hypothetical protein
MGAVLGYRTGEYQNPPQPMKTVPRIYYLFD